MALSLITPELRFDILLGLPKLCPASSRAFACLLAALTKKHIYLQRAPEREYLPNRLETQKRPFGRVVDVLFTPSSYQIMLHIISGLANG
jgi:hypothetical protein